ncbi:uncharacterized protein LOC143860833 [Tasmannia lanceolata]|uniref:uncharacterized protein LOC143860833 n=1 Tax=Tasmannia lanceolata TaxID=3420 RepID=UPI0040632F76
MADLHPPVELATINGGASLENLGPPLGSKRQRRPSVRLGDIGEQSAAAITYEAYLRRSKPLKISSGHVPVRDGKGSRTRPLTNLGNGDCHETLEIDDKIGSGEENLDSLGLGFGPWVKDSKVRRGGGVVKRTRSNWVSKVEEGDEKFSGDEDNVGFRDLELERSESPLKDLGQSPIHLMENIAMENEREGMARRMVRARVSESRDHDQVELDAPSDMDARDWKCGMSEERNGLSDRQLRSLEDGVRMWLNGLGLGRYESVFELHEVDEEVLPLLTLEDLKDMGINAVGSRRKMYSAIQKLRKGFT